ncbi:sulfate ABC transporter substrate-binding protein, partial [Rickettsiales bacterium]|nr:sulfate ABC transporter substrate-binding protein [Rickettsiales bacterium]
DKNTVFNVSFDTTRELYRDYNKLFKEYWLNKTGEEIKIYGSFGGSGKQARSVIDGLKADVVTLALNYDINAIAKKQGSIDKDWQKEFPNNSSAYLSTVVFLVRKGNPKNIKDWDDLIQEDIKVITPNPKSSGGARWNYMAIYSYAKTKYKNEEKVKDFIKKIFTNVPILDVTSRAATTTFVARDIGDIVISPESEAYLAIEKLGADKFDIIYPSSSILVDSPIAIIDKRVDKKGNREVATQYLQYLYSDEAAEIFVKNHYRPVNKKILNKYRDKFPRIKLYTIKQLGGWEKAQKEHFDAGALFDQIYRQIVRNN